MNKFQYNSPEPEFKSITPADIQQAYGHIPALCQNLHNFQEFLNTKNPINEEARVFINTMLTEAKFGLTSMTELIVRLLKENQVLSQQSESKNLRQELDIERAHNVQLNKTICHLTASEMQLKADLLNAYQSTQRRIVELEEEIAGHHQSPATSFQQNGFGENEVPTLGRFISKPHQTVKRLNKATQKSRPVSAQQTPLTPENRTNWQKPIPEPIPMQLDTISQFSTCQPEDIPAEDFIINSEKIERTDVGSSRLLLTNILNKHYGLVVGRGGQNAERLEREFGVKIRILNRQDQSDNLKIMISEGDADSRRAASDDIIKNLPVDVNCPNIKSYGHALKNAIIQCRVTINQTNLDNRGVTICGRLANCHQAYKMLQKNETIWYPK